jgi:hypothetical protein
VFHQRGGEALLYLTVSALDVVVTGDRNTMVYEEVHCLALARIIHVAEPV